MTEASYFWTTNNTGDGPSAGYAQTALFNVFRALFAKAHNVGGVSPDFLNELAVSGTATPVSVAAGGAVVYGIPYFSDAAVTVAIATPSGATRIDRIVLRASWSAQTVRVTRIAGSEGGAAPDLVQSAGATWDIPLARVSITTGGVITVTDERQWLDMTGDGAVVADKIAAAAVSNAKMANMDQSTIKGRAAGAGTGPPGDMTAAAARTLLNVADGANAYVHPNHSGDVTSTGDGATAIANNAVVTAKVIDAAITNAKLANMVQATIKGRAASTGTGAPVDLTAAQARAILNVADGATAYVHPNHSGDVTSTGDGATAIASNAVTEAKINSGAVTEAKIGAGAVTADKIGSNAVTTAKVNNGAVTQAKLGSDTLRMMTIPLGAVPLTTTNTTFTSTSKRFAARFDVAKFPAGATVKLTACLQTTNGSHAVTARLVGISASEASVSGAAQPDIGVSGDFRSSLSAGTATYEVEFRIANASATATIHHAHLLVEW